MSEQKNGFCGRLGPFLMVLPVFVLFGYQCHSTKPVQDTARLVTGASIPFDLTQPTLTINIVSADLQEISGLSPTDEKGLLAAIADEKGEAFLVDATGSGAIKYRLLFKEKGDFEGIEIVNNTLYAVTSSGKIYEVTDWRKPEHFQVTEYITSLEKVNDVEGLCFDKQRNALLLTTKEDPETNKDRTVWAFDLKQKQLSSTPVYTIHPDQVLEKTPWNDQDKKRYFSPSGIAIHPVTNDIYVLSTALKRLAVFDYNTGALKSAAYIDKQILPQPEGISFDKDGNLYISSEGKEGEGLLLFFQAKK